MIIGKLQYLALAATSLILTFQFFRLRHKAGHSPNARNPIGRHVENLLDHVGEEYNSVRERVDPEKERPAEVENGQENEDPAGRSRVVLGELNRIQVLFSILIRITLGTRDEPANYRFLPEINRTEKW